MCLDVNLRPYLSVGVPSDSTKARERPNMMDFLIAGVRLRLLFKKASVKTAPVLESVPLCLDGAPS
jgi:hypothetical protein